MKMKNKFLIHALAIIFILLIVPAKSFAEMPDITAGQTYFNVFKGYYVLKDNVHVVMNNHGVKATITANEARVNVMTQKCWALGEVTFTHDQASFTCDKAFLQWKTKTADITGPIKFENKKVVSITADNATFNWEDKNADFYGNVKVKGEKKLQFADDLKLEKDTTYTHVRYNIRDNQITVLEKDSTVPEIIIPEDPDNDDAE